MSEIGIGAIGCGGFGMFALEQMAQLEGVRIRAVADSNEDVARAAAEKFGARVLSNEALVEAEDVDLVYTATPPFLHHAIGMMALRAGRHVICEKPLALTMEEGQEMVTLARAKNLACVANLMQPFNPLFDRVLELVRSRILGDVLHGFFENYASDEKLSPRHWFWDARLSGGIFVEHGVHFFDLFERWLGEGRVIAASALRRPPGEGGQPLEDQVECTAMYAGAPGARFDETSAASERSLSPVSVHFYHGFTQPSRLDRQEFRLLFQRGDLTLSEWVPVRARLDAIVDERGEQALKAIFEGAQTEVVARYAGDERRGLARHEPFDVDRRIVLDYGRGVPKWDRYAEIVQALAADQVAWIRNRVHPRRVTEENGLHSLQTAVAASRLAGITTCGT